MLTADWSITAKALYAELARSRGRIALVVGRNADDVVSSWAGFVDQEVVSVGRRVTEDRKTLLDVSGALATAGFLTDLDVLFWPTLKVDPLGLLGLLARSQPRIAVWPGAISSRRATYSAPGRLDHYDGPIRDALVLRAHHADFPDQIPFDVERIV